MQFEELAFWVYVILLLVGGLAGFLKAGSKVSLVTSVVAAALLALTAVPGILQPGFARGAADLILVALLVVFAGRLVKTRKFMPGGLMLVLTILMLALENIFKR